MDMVLHSGSSLKHLFCMWILSPGFPMHTVIGSGSSLKHLFACGFSYQVLLPMKIERCM
jgi:hypothetical protein